jgi:hypothetical protein
MRTVGAPLERAAAIADAAIYRAAAGRLDVPAAARTGGLIGVLTPPAHAAGHPNDRAHVHAECLVVTDPGAVLRVRVRWLQIMTRVWWGARPGGSAWASGGTTMTLVTDAETDIRTEFVPHEVDEDVMISDLLAARTAPPPALTGGWSRGWLPHPSAPRPDPWEPGGSGTTDRHRASGHAHTIRLSAPASRRVRTVDRGDAAPARIAWDSWSAQGELRLSAGLATGGRPLVRLRAELVNTSGWHPHMDGAGQGRPGGHAGDAPCERALRHALIGAHVILSADRGGFVSLTAPPEWARQAAQECVNDGLWPAVIGTATEPSAVLISPVRLADNPGPHAGRRAASA